jgi:hypothetical protein
MPKEKKPSQQEIDDAIRDRGPFYKDSKGKKSQIPSKEMFEKMHPSDLSGLKGAISDKEGSWLASINPDRTAVESEINNVDQLGNVISANPAYAMGGLTEQPHLGYIPRSKGGSILAKGNKLAKHKPTKLY